LRKNKRPRRDTDARCSTPVIQVNACRGISWQSYRLLARRLPQPFGLCLRSASPRPSPAQRPRNRHGMTGSRAREGTIAN
jgi:hypothetical protein